MENSLVRLSMNVHRPNTFEKRDGALHVNHQTTSLHSRPKFPRTHTKTNQRSVNRTARYGDWAEDYKTFSGQWDEERCLLEQSIRRTDAYVQISSQFVLLPGTPYADNVEIDSTPAWEHVASVTIYDTDGLACPICLHSPVTPRMDKCGHIYCWPCAIQYIMYENEGGTKKCAVCSRIMSIKDLKRVSIHQVDPVEIGKPIKMVLVKRAKSNSSVSPVLPLKSSKMFLNVYSCNESELKAASQNDLETLQTYKAICEGDESTSELVPYIDVIIDWLVSIHSSENCGNDKFEKTNVLPDEINRAKNEANEFYFFQAEDGQPIYLDGLMWRCLMREYQSVHSLPLEISAVVLSLSAHRMDQRFRKRLPYLRHLPLGRMFSLVELELKPPLVSECTLTEFAPFLYARESERNRQRLEDLKLTKLKVAAENQIPTITPGFVLSGHVDLSSPPNFNSSEFMPLKSASVKQTMINKFTTSFADVSRSGALAIVGPKRVANFSRSIPSTSHMQNFSMATEDWPTLGESSVAPRNFDKASCNTGKTH